ncbi:MAG: hypothetical protein KC621_23135 [Myxococcales bacterium]|nr:hypothetical protein [Myxococcales bacterium]
MSVIKRLANVAYGKMKTTLSPEDGPVVDEVERLRPPPVPREEEPAVDREEEAEPEPVKERPTTPRPRRL